MAVSISLLLSYVVDWLVIIIAAIVGAVFNFIPPNHRAFNLVDPEISFPITDPETVSVRTLGLVALFAPAVIIPLVCLLLVPGPTVARAVPRAVVWRRKLWEWHTGWLGLALSCAMTFFFTQGLKLLFGRQRPDLLARCFPDGPPDDARIKQFQVGGLGEIELQSMGAILVQWGICRQPDVGILHDGFMSFPSGHASFSWAGLLYLSLFLCSKFAVTIPYLLPGAYDASGFRPQTPSPQGSSENSKHTKNSTQPLTTDQHPATAPPMGLSHVLRSQAAAPPVYLLALALVPVGVAMFITASRYTDYRHHATDLVAGSLLGVVGAYASFRWLHAPIRRGAGWSWGPRSHDRAWWVGVGVQGYAGEGGRKRSDEEGLSTGDLEHTDGAGTAR